MHHVHMLIGVVHIFLHHLLAGIEEDGVSLEVAGLNPSVVAELSVNVFWRDLSELLVLLLRDRKNLSHMHKRGAIVTRRVGI